MQFSEGNYCKLKEVVSRHGVEVPGIDEFVAFEKEKEGADKKSQPDRIKQVVGTQSEPPVNWHEVFAGSDLTNADGLAQTYAAFRKTKPPLDHEQFFKEAIRRVPVGAEPALIEAVGNIPKFDPYLLWHFLKQVPDAWKGRPATASALAATLKAVCRRYCMVIARSRRYELLPLKMACAMAGTSEADVVNVVLDAVGETSDPADSNRLFSLVGLLIIKLSEDQALEALKFGLKLFTSTLEETDGDGPWSSELLPPNDIKASLAGYIWASMAAPEGVLRWEGSHTVLGLVLGRYDVLNHVMNLAAERKAGPFVDAGLPFYSLHALQWFLIGVARAATEFPATLTPFVNQIVDWALKDQPHVLIRQFAARAGLALMEHGVLADRENLKDRLGRVNESSLAVVESKTYRRIRPKKTHASTASDNDRYYFGLDIGQYWYEPLGRVFALGRDEVETEALKVIRTEFGFTGNGRWDEDERSRRKLYQEERTYYQGSHPRADTLHFYHAYHAMMVVAGKLLARMPTHRDPEFGEEDEFADWLDRHDLSRKDRRWLWDRRDPTPLEHPSWQDRKRGKDTLPVVTVDDFEEALHAGGAMLNVWGHWTAADSELEQSVHISSALLSPDKSLALLRALVTAKDVHYYALPSAGSDMEIDEFGFTLKGWIVDDRRTEDWTARIVGPVVSVFLRQCPPLTSLR